LGPLDRLWEPAIAAALPVLRKFAVVPEEGSDDAEALMVHISTEKFWEQCLELALTSAFPSLAVSRDATPGEGVTTPAPWVQPRREGECGSATTEAFPDFMFISARHVVVADAKYKLSSGGAPSSQDGYQLFAYSHLARLGGKSSNVAVLMYPARVGERTFQRKLERMPDRDYILWSSRLPFPARSDLCTNGNWSAYIALLTETILDHSSYWSVGSTHFATPPASTRLEDSV